jgi:site-specific recombinase XerD
MEDIRERMIGDMKLRGLAPCTQATYLEAVKVLARHCNSRLDEITKEQVRDFLLYLLDSKGYAKSTYKVYLSAIKFLYLNTLDRQWRFLPLARANPEKKLPIVLSREEVWSLLDLVRRDKPRMSLILMYTCGLRVSEAVHLRPQDIDSQRMVLWVRKGKGGKDRSVPLPSYTLTQLRTYWLKYKPKKWLFPSEHSMSAITKSCVQRCLTATLRRSNIRKNVNCHTLRHSYATHLVEAGVHLRMIQSLLGHKSLSSTFIYIHLSQSTRLDVQTKIDRLMRRD